MSCIIVRIYSNWPAAGQYNVMYMTLYDIQPLTMSCTSTCIKSCLDDIVCFPIRTATVGRGTGFKAASLSSDGALDIYFRPGDTY